MGVILPVGSYQVKYAGPGDRDDRLFDGYRERLSYLRSAKQ